MKTTCAGCSKALGAKPSEIHVKTIITHGLCEKCANKFFGEMGEDLKTFIDGLPAPVVVVDPDVSVKTANARALVLLEKSLDEVGGYKGGDVFECAYAKLPEGCGRTIHCSGCAIRRTVTDTLKSGRSHLKVPAHLHSGDADHYRDIDLLISTEKVGKIVLLRIDKFDGKDTAQPDRC
jgi:hypothetical protein